MKKPSKLLSAFLSLLLALFLLAGSIAVPILWRGFYYGQIDALDLPARSGFDRETIQTAFDDVMDYLVLNREFGTGDLRWSDSGRAHFADCRVLFRLDFVILTVTGAVLLLLVLLYFIFPGFRSKLAFSPLKGALIFLLVVLLILGVWAFVDFDGLFVMFHKLFFPGKENWIFNYRTDQIILILPEDFWARAAGLVAALALGSAAVLAVLPSVFRHLFTSKTVYEQLSDMK